ncbi:MAG: glycosyltransferase family 4 protein [Anaerolineae bacterium]
MRILFLTNFYPPHELGGQGQSCRQVVGELQARGHQTLVLTSMHGTNNRPVESAGVSRSLYLEMDLVPWRQSLTFFFKRNAREAHNLRRLRHLLAKFQPDVVFVWGMWNLPRSLPALAEAERPGKVLYRFADYWPTLPSQHEQYWRAEGRNWLAKLPKRVLAYIALKILAFDGEPPALKFEHAICVSAATRDILVKAGIPISNAWIIHTGLNAEQFMGSRQSNRVGSRAENLNLLYAGRLSADKGVEVTIEAMTKLVFDHNLTRLRLSMAGSGSADYENHLRSLVNRAGLADYVSFLGRVPRQDMPALMGQFDILLVPSTWQEPFARVVLEGMSAGLAVVATPTGGTGEIVADGETGLLFTPGDAGELAQKIAALAADAQLRRRLAAAGRQTVAQKFTTTRMMNQIEACLQEIAALPAPPPPGHKQPAVA